MSLFGSHSLARSLSLTCAVFRCYFLKMAVRSIRSTYQLKVRWVCVCSCVHVVVVAFVCCECEQKLPRDWYSFPRLMFIPLNARESHFDSCFVVPETMSPYDISCFFLSTLSFSRCFSWSFNLRDFFFHRQFNCDAKQKSHVNNKFTWICILLNVDRFFDASNYDGKVKTKVNAH